MPLTLQAWEIKIAIGRIACDAVPRRTYKKFMWERIKSGYVFVKLLTLLLHLLLSVYEACTLRNVTHSPLWLFRYCRKCTFRKVVQTTAKRTSYCPSYDRTIPAPGTNCKWWEIKGASLLMGHCVLVIEMLLLMAGDVERNPGPTPPYDEERHTKNDSASVSLDAPIHYDLSLDGGLTISDLAVLQETLHQVRVMWYDIGVQLRMDVRELDSIRCDFQDPRECLREMLKEWLKGSGRDPPTWSAIVAALCSKSVGESALGTQLGVKYCPTEYLTEEDLTWLLDAVKGVAYRWYDIGLSLGFLGGELRNIQSMPRLFSEAPHSFLREMLSQWLKWAEPNHKPPTLELLASALRNNGEEALAQSLKLCSIHRKAQTKTLTAKVLYSYEAQEDDELCLQPGQMVEILSTSDDGWWLGKYGGDVGHLPSNYVELVQSEPAKGMKLGQPLLTHETAQAKPLLAEVLYSYEAQEDDELSLQPGQVVEILSTAEDEWWLGKYGDDVGLLPSNYVELVQSQPAKGMKSQHLLSRQEGLQSQAVFSSHCQLVTSPGLAEYVKYLKAIYSADTVPTETKWPPSPTEHYINLACISKAHVSRKEADDFTRATIRGDIDDILEKKGPMDFNQVAKLPDGSQPQVVLVDGAPGVGKTTFAWEFCRRWASGRILQEYGLVVLMRLRDRRVKEAQTLKDLLYHPDAALRQDVAREIQSKQGKGVVILLEGFDELPVKLGTESSIFLDIIYGRCLPNATVVITSRPWASGGLRWSCRKRISQHIEILGFTKLQIDSYLHSVLGNDPGLLQGIKTYLSCYPHIHTAMYIPLNTVIVVEVYKSASLGDYTIPKTMTELYMALARTLLLRYLYEHPVHRKRKWRIRTFNDLPHDVYWHLSELCRIAHGGILNQQQVIFSDLPDDFQTLGFMQSVPELYLDEGSLVSHNFLHLTLQEFLAALFIAQQEPDSITGYFQQHISQKMKHLDVMLKFLAGLTQLKSTPHKDLIPQIDSCRMLFLEYGSHYINIHFVTGTYLIDTYLNADLVIDANCVNWLFESQNCSFIREACDTKIIVFDGRNCSSPFDYYALGYCIVSSCSSWKLFFERPTMEDIEMLLIGAKEHVEVDSRASVNAILTSTFSANLTSLSPYVYMDDLQLVMIVGQSDSICLESVYPHSLLHTLRLCSFNLTIPFNTFPWCGLVTLQLSQCNLDNERACTLFQTLCENVTLKILDLSYNTELGTTYGYAPLPQMNVEQLSLEYCAIDGDKACPLAQQLFHSSTITLDGNQGDDHIRGITCAEMLQKNKTLEQLCLRRCNLSDEQACQIAQGLCCNTTLKKLDISYNTIASPQTISAFADMLCKNSTLECLHVAILADLRKYVRHLIATLTINSTLYTLHVQCFYNRFSLSDCFCFVFLDGYCGQFHHFIRHRCRLEYRSHYENGDIYEEVDPKLILRF